MVDSLAYFIILVYLLYCVICSFGFLVLQCGLVASKPAVEVGAGPTVTPTNVNDMSMASDLSQRSQLGMVSFPMWATAVPWCYKRVQSRQHELSNDDKGVQSRPA